jgi:hypothetical protein
MIVVRLDGGLGNQLFQYALGRHLALQHGAELKLDCHVYELDFSRRYLLDQFSINAARASFFDIWKVCPKEAMARIIQRLRPSRLAHKVVGWIDSPYRFGGYEHPASCPPLRHGIKIVRERWFHFDPEVLQIPPGCALIGHWLSERYFRSSRGQLIKELRLPPIQKELGRRITGCESVSLHVRRGDFVDSPRHTATSAAYCREAMKFFRSRLSRPQFFVFSDDFAWVQAQLPAGPDMHLVSLESTAGEVEDFRLMSQCRHHITAASTFSWWAAWLNDSPGRLVVAPAAEAWYRDPFCQPKDLLPADWITLPAG